VESYRLSRLHLVPHALGAHRHLGHEVHVLVSDLVAALPHAPHLLMRLALHGHELLHNSVATGNLERGHHGPLLVGGVRRILVVVEVGEVLRPVVVDLVEHLGVGRVEDLRVRRPRYRPGGPSGGGGGGRIAPQLGAELAAELGRSASSVENGLLLVVGVPGIPPECLRCGLIARERARAISMILA
jgi:hypothetical protein